MTSSKSPWLFATQIHQVSGRSVSTPPSPGRSVPLTSPTAWPRPALRTLQMLWPGREIPWSWAPGPLDQWIGLLGKICRKPWISPLNMGLSCKFSLKPIHWLEDFSDVTLCQLKMLHLYMMISIWRCVFQLCYEIPEGQTVKHVFWWKCSELPIVFAGSGSWQHMATSPPMRMCFNMFTVQMESIWGLFSWASLSAISPLKGLAKTLKHASWALCSSLGICG